MTHTQPHSPRPDMAPRVALVGHCGPDAHALTSAIKGVLAGATIDRLDRRDAFDERKGSYDLLVVNRVLDGDYGDASGIGLIRGLGEGDPPAMLISNYPESIKESVAAGAARGFGKAEMRSETAAAALRDALGIAPGS